MGYIILGIIILLLLTVFMNDLYRNYRGRDEEGEYHAYRGQMYHSEFADDFDVNDDLDDVIADEEDAEIARDIDAPIWNPLGGTVFPDQVNQKILIDDAEFSEEFDDEGLAVAEDETELDKEELRR